MAWSVWPGFSWASSLGGQPAQLVVDQRQQLLGGLRVALLDGGQKMRVTSLMRSEDNRRREGAVKRPSAPVYPRYGRCVRMSVSCVPLWRCSECRSCIAGFVKNGVVVPNVPLPEGAFVEVRVIHGPMKSRRNCKPNSTPGSGRAASPWSWSNDWPRRAKPMQRGEVWRVRLPSAAGHAQAGVRPAVIVQEDQATRRCRPC